MTVTIDQAAGLLSRSRRTIYNRIREGCLQTIRVGTSQRVTVESLMRQPECRPRSDLRPLKPESFIQPRTVS